MKHRFQKLPLVAALTLGLSLPLAASSQTPCKYVKAKTDEWTKKVTNTAQMTIGAGITGREVILQESEGKYYLGLRIIYNTDFPEVAFKKGDKITFKLADDRQIEVASEKDVPAELVRFMDVPLRQWVVRGEVSKEVYSQLAASPITAIKYHLNGNDYPLPEIKERQTKKIMETAGCMLTATTASSSNQ